MVVGLLVQYIVAGEIRRAEHSIVSTRIAVSQSPLSNVLQTNTPANPVGSTFCKMRRIQVHGKKLTSPIQLLEYSKIPSYLMDDIRAKKIFRQAPNQVSSVPCIVGGRDMLYIAVGKRARMIHDPHVQKISDLMWRHLRT